MLEGVILQKITPLLDQNDLQFGFTAKSSPVYASLVIAEARDQHTPVHMVALDVKKTFDTVDHLSLLRKHHHQRVDDATWPYLRQNLEQELWNLEQELK